MENMLLFFMAALTALSAENAIFARSLGLSKTVLFINRPQTGILYGALFTWMITVSSLLVSGLNRFLTGNPHVSVLRFPGFLACVSLVYVCTYLCTKQWMRQLFNIIHRALPVSTFNSALFGAFYVSAANAHGVFQTVGYALGTGVGYTIAILIIYYARKRLAISPVPRSFRGLPVLLVYIGLLSLALYGLIGHGLPI